MERQTRDLSEAEFLGNVDLEDATAYRLLAIGEAAKGLDDATRARHPDIPWNQVVAMRNILAHEYFVRESRIIWQTVKVSLPALAEACRSELVAHGWNPAGHEPG
ncbi:MAG TPA: HepT-like ribonuclease domain-containing protein [Acetobacteraceae bacterium]|nr:HepT-like ribonuclease domain-containing protein [Acetobacteraceae bacterium]